MLSRSCVPGISGTGAHWNANSIQEHGNAEHERIGTLNSRSCAEMTGHNVEGLAYGAVLSL